MSSVSDYTEYPRLFILSIKKKIREVVIYLKIGKHLFYKSDMLYQMAIFLICGFKRKYLIKTANEFLRMEHDIFYFRFEFYAKKHETFVHLFLKKYHLKFSNGL